MCCHLVHARKVVGFCGRSFAWCVLSCAWVAWSLLFLFMLMVHPLVIWSSDQLGTVDPCAWAGKCQRINWWRLICTHAVVWSQCFRNVVIWQVRLRSKIWSRFRNQLFFPPIFISYKQTKECYGLALQLLSVVCQSTKPRFVLGLVWDGWLGEFGSQKEPGQPRSVWVSWFGCGPGAGGGMAPIFVMRHGEERGNPGPFPMAIWQEVGHWSICLEWLCVSLFFFFLAHCW